MTKSSARAHVSCSVISPGTIESSRAPVTRCPPPPTNGSSGGIELNCVPQSGPSLKVMVVLVP
jgi:hypothetical protein